MKTAQHGLVLHGARSIDQLRYTLGGGVVIRPSFVTSSTPVAMVLWRWRW